MKIAILGSRGIPANYGGFETFAERLSTGLVEKGHEVTVYCCSTYSTYKETFYKGVKRAVLPSIRFKSLEKILFSLLSLIHVSFTKNKLILMLGVSGSLFCFIPRISGKRIVINIDGLEWKRKKWGKLAAFYLRFSEQLAGITCNKVVTDSRAIQEYYLNRYSKSSAYIAYGAEVKRYTRHEQLKKYDLTKDNYLLYVSRLEPENNAHLIISSFEQVKTNMLLVIVGSSPYNSNYYKRLKSTKDRRIKFLGTVYGEDYKELQSNAFLYVHGNEVGGTNPALLEAMGYGNCVLVLDVPYNREVISDAGVLYKKSVENLREKMQYLIDNPDMVKKYRRKAQERIAAEYTWEKIINQYEELFASFCKN
jgi:glycosyltransferase involved in cell wall biosynthesis